MGNFVFAHCNGGKVKLTRAVTFFIVYHFPRACKTFRKCSCETRNSWEKWVDDDDDDDEEASKESQDEHRSTLLKWSACLFGLHTRLWQIMHPLKKESHVQRCMHEKQPCMLLEASIERVVIHGHLNMEIIYYCMLWVGDLFLNFILMFFLLQLGIKHWKHV